MDTINAGSIIKNIKTDSIHRNSFLPQDLNFINPIPDKNNNAEKGIWKSNNINIVARGVGG